MPDSSGWFPSVTLLIGFATGAVTEWLRDRRTEGRERKARKEARRDQFLERRKDFQRQTLLDLQEAVMELIRTAGEMHYQDLMASRKAGKWVSQPVTDELNERARIVQARTTLLSVRVRDDSVRGFVDELKGHASSLVVSKSQAESEATFANINPIFQKLNERVGQLLREMDDLPS
jgi:hypothetical protein